MMRANAIWLGLALCLTPPSLAAAQTGAPAAPAALLAQNAQPHGPAEKKLDMMLLLATRPPVAGLTRPSINERPPKDAAGRVELTVTAKITPDLIKAVTALGGAVEYVPRNPDDDTLPIRLALDKVASLAARPDVYFVRLMLPVTVNQVDPEGDKAHAADVVRDSMNVRGQGIKIGVISDTLNDLNDSYGKAVKANYVSKVTVVTDQYGAAQDGSFWCTPFYQHLGHCEAEGLAMLEIVHRLAPDAELFFATSGNSTSNMDDNIIELAAKGCNVIIDDVTFPPESPFQDGAIAKAVSKVSQQGVLYFSSAGNNGNRQAGTSSTFEGNYLEFGPAPATLTAAPSTGGGIAAFPSRAGPTDRIVLNPPPDSCNTSVYLYWADPLANRKAGTYSPNQYAVFAFDRLGALFGGATMTPGTGVNPMALFSTAGITAHPCLQAGDYIQVWKAANAAPRFLHLEATHSQFQDQNSATDGSTRGHNASAAANAFTVGATEAPWPQPTQIESFSSDGPRRMFFNPDGTPGDYTYDKPDVFGADGVSTSLPRDSYLNPFYGTSAAAPHVGAIAALILSAHSSPQVWLPQNLTPAQVRFIIDATSLQDGPFAASPVRYPNFNTAPRLPRHGLAMADAAVGLALGINRRIKMAERDLQQLVASIRLQSPRQYTVDGRAVFFISNTGTIGGFVPTGDPANPYHSVALPTRLAVKRYSAVGGYRGRFYALGDDGEIWKLPTW